MKQEKRNPLSHDDFDLVLRAELYQEAPPELTSRLLQLVDDSLLVSQPHAEHARASALNQYPIPARPGPYYSMLVMILTTLAVSLSFAVTWQVYGTIGSELGLNAIWSQVQVAIASGLQSLYQELPAMQHVVGWFQSFYDHMAWMLNWLLVAIILWLTLDGYSSGSHLQQQTS